MELKKQKIENFTQLPWHNFFLWHFISEEEGGNLLQEHFRDELEVELYPVPATMPLDDFLALPEGAPFELHTNQPFFMPAPTPYHQQVITNLLSRLHLFVDDNEMGRVLPAPVDVQLPGDSVIQPDIIFISNEREEHLKRNGLHAAPNWAAEILSPSTRDRDEGFKLKLLSENGAVEYWIIHPDEKWVKQYVLDEESNVLVLKKKYEGENEKIESIAVKGFSITTKKLFKGTE